jgi:polysaccharide chain length determinant protein (PEP-CTERM system associated)
MLSSFRKAGFNVINLAKLSINFLPELPQPVLDELLPYWRRRNLLFVVAWLICLFGWTAVAFLPDRYEAMTRLYIETDNMLTPLLRNIAVQADMQKQLEVLQRTLLNRNNMAKVAHATDLDLLAQTDVEKERLYDSLSRRINVRAEGQNLFSVTFSSGDPQEAKRVVETLLNIFVETNLGQNRTSMENAQSFLENQLAEYELKLKQADQKLADYKSQHLDVLSATGANFSGRVENGRQALNAAQAKYDDAVILRDQLKNTLANTPPTIDVEAQPQVVIGAGGRATSTTGSPRLRVRQLQQELANLQAQYTEQHPDVIVAKRALATAEAELKREDEAKKDGVAPTTSNGGTPNPVYEQVKLRLIQVEGEVAQAQSQLAVAKEEVGRLQSFAVTAPNVEADLSDLTREYSVIKGKYEELLGRRESARISAAVEVSGDKLQFRVIEPPKAPSRPNFPNRPMLATVVLIAGLAAGGALIFLLHKFDETINTDVVLTEDFNIRVLGTVTRFETPALAASRLRRNGYFLIASGSLLATYALFIAATQLYQLSELTAQIHLPAFFKRIIDFVA